MNTTETSAYKIEKTAAKAAPAFVVIILANAAKAALQAAGITCIDDQTIFNIALAGAGAVLAFINWIKNRNKKY